MRKTYGKRKMYSGKWKTAAAEWRGMVFNLLALLTLRLYQSGFAFFCFCGVG